MKKEIHFPLTEISFYCINCSREYKTSSTSSQDIRIESCSNCNPFYTGVSASKVKVGEVEKYRRKVEIAKEKIKEKTLDQKNLKK